MELLITSIIVVMALILDRLFGEPQYHPLIIFGHCANWIEQRLNRNHSRLRGAIATLIVILPPVAVVAWLQWINRDSIIISSVLSIGILYFSIGWQSMKEHAFAVVDPLQSNDMSEARSQLSMIVSRDTDIMNEQQIVGSTLESVLENSNDCLFASIFWSILLGPFAVLLHRLVNTLDAMWGYKNQQFRFFGTFPARLDDVLGYLPARLTAATFSIIGCTRGAVQSWRSQAPVHKSPNGGVVMSSGAGALNIQFGGPTVYNGKLEDKPVLGSGRTAQAHDIKRSVLLIECSTFLWIAIIGSIGLIQYLMNYITQL